MSVTLPHSPADIVRWLLVALGLGTDPAVLGAWPVYATGEPDRPDDCLTVYDTTASDHGREMVTGEVQLNYGIQVRVRAIDHQTGWAKADVIWTTLCKNVYQQQVDVEGSAYLVHALVGIRSPIPLGKDSPKSKRSLFVVNCMAVIRVVGN